MKAKFITYGRVSPIRGTWGQWEVDSYILHTHVILYVTEGVPIYARGQHLVIETIENIYRIYNPQRLRFNYDKLASGFKTYLISLGETIISERIEQE